MTREDAVYDICEGIKQEKIVPILGDNVFRVKYKNNLIPLQQFIVYSLLEENDIDEAKELCEKSSLRCMKELEKKLANRGKDFHRELNKLFKSPTFCQGLIIDESTRCLLRRGKFELVILATIISAEKVEQLIANDVYRKYGVVEYRTESMQSQDISLSDTMKMIRPTLFHLFGGFSYNEKCVITEKDFLFFLHCLHDTNRQPKSLRTYLDNKHILALGCEMPDWTFRFMLYSLKSSGETIGNTNANQFGGGAADISLEPELIDFLEDIHYYPDNDIKSLLGLICESLPEAEPKPGLFLSYSAEEGSRDYKSILQIKKVLDEKFEVYFFPDNPESRKGGFKYWKDIEDALCKCDYFMPVITDKLLRKFDKIYVSSLDPQKDIKGEPGFVSEWKLALKNTFKKIIPYRIEVDLEDFKESLMRDDKKIFRPLFLGGDGSQHISIDPFVFTIDDISL